jgi:hypothetical protein
VADELTGAGGYYVEGTTASRGSTAANANKRHFAWSAT